MKTQDITVKVKADTSEYDAALERVMMQPAQDLLDGAALRRLREAVEPDGRDIALRTWPDGRWWVAVEDWNKRETPATAEGVTIAKAADKCREALEGED